MNQTIYINPQTCQKNNYDKQYFFTFSHTFYIMQMFLQASSHLHSLEASHFQILLEEEKGLFFFFTILSNLTTIERKLCENANNSLLALSILCSDIRY